MRRLRSPAAKVLPAPRFVLVDRPVRDAMYRYFEVGAHTPANAMEQICALGGKGGQYIVHVRMLLPLEAEFASSGMVKVSALAWYQAILALRAEGLALVGSIHSHPGALPVFLSWEDQNTHQQMFPRGVSLVINPHRKKIAAFNCKADKILIEWE